MALPPYEKMLDLALSKVKRKEGDERFVIPNFQIISTKNKTIIKNFSDVAKKIRRDPAHLLRFFIKKFTARAEILPNGEASFYQKINQALIKDVFSQYLKKYVICQTCGKYDTILTKQGEFYVLKCEACGAERQILG